MVGIEDIPDFTDAGTPLPGQRPTPGVAPTVTPVPVVLVTTRLDSSGEATPLNAAVVDSFIAAEIAAGRAYETTVERWDPWTALTLPLGYGAASAYNYARITLDGRNFYAYVSAGYQNLTTTAFTVAADDWTTYAPTIGYSTILRGHVAVAASINDTYGDQYCTAPEPLSAPPVRGVLNSSVLDSTPEDWTVMVISANDLRGGTGNPFWDRHVAADLIMNAGPLASSATVDSEGTVQAYIPNAQYPWAVGGSNPALIDTISPGHSITNPGGTIASAWQWHIDNNGGRGGVDWNYAYGTEFTAPADGVVDHFDVAGVGMVVRLTLNAPIERTSPQQPVGDQPGPIYSIWFQHCSEAYDGPANQGDVIGKSGDGYGEYGAHLHVHALSNTSSSAGSTNRSNMWGFIEGGEGGGPDVYVPKVTGSAVSTIDGVAAGGGVYLFTIDGFAQYMTIMQGAPWVTSGIIDTRLVPSWAVGVGGAATYTPAKSSTDPSDPMWAIAASIPVFVGKVDTATITSTVLSSWRSTVLAALGATGWAKLHTSQFMDIVVGNGDTTRSYKPELWRTSGIQFQAVNGGTHGESSTRIIPIGYNELGSQMAVETPVGGQAGLTHSGYGLAGANTASSDLTPYLNAYSARSTWLTTLRNKQLATSLGLTEIAMNAGVQGVSTVMGAVQGAAGGALVAGGPGAIAGAAAGAVGSIGSMATSSITTQNAITMLDVSTDGSFDITALSLALSSEAAVTTFDTWKQSLSAISGGGTAHRIASAWRAIIGQGFDVIITAPDPDAVKRAISTWSRYGYTIDRAFVPPRMDAMDKYTYWKMEDVAVLGAMPSDARERIAARFLAGTTIWTNVAEIGTQPVNTPRPGVSY